MQISGVSIEDHVTIGGNLPENLLPQADLSGTQEDLSWRRDSAELVAKSVHRLKDGDRGPLIVHRKSL